MKTITKILGIGMLGLVSLVGCIEKDKVETRYVSLNPEAQINKSPTYNKDSTEIIFPTYIISAVGIAEYYNNSSNPRHVSIGGQDSRINGDGYDFNEDGLFDKLEKDNPPDNFSFSELEAALNDVKSRVEKVSRNDIFTNWVPRK